MWYSANFTVVCYFDRVTNYRGGTPRNRLRLGGERVHDRVDCRPPFHRQPRFSIRQKTGTPRVHRSLCYRVCHLRSRAEHEYADSWKEYVHEVR